MSWQEQIIRTLPGGYVVIRHERDEWAPGIPGTTQRATITVDLIDGTKISAEIIGQLTRTLPPS